MARNRKKKSTKILYILAALWLFWSGVFPLYALRHFIVLIVASVFLVRFVKKLLPSKEEVEGQPQDKNTADKNNAVNSSSPNAQNANPYSKGYTVSYQTGMAGGAGGRAGQPGQNTDTQYDPARAEAERKAREEAERKAREEAEAKAREEAIRKAREEAERKEAEAKAKLDPNSPLLKPMKKRNRTGDQAIDKLLDEEEKAVLEMRRLDDSIVDEKLSAQIVHLEEVTTKIVDFIVEHPKKKNQVRRFFNYYLPTSLKLLNAYDRMDETGISGMNIDGTKGKVEEMMDTALESFDKQLDALYADEALDVASEIKVMENMLAQEGLVDDGLQELMKK